MLTNVDWHSLIITGGGVAILGKFYLILVHSMPPPPANCGFWCRWGYDFMQSSAENLDKIGVARIKTDLPGTLPVVVSPGIPIPERPKDPPPDAGGKL